MIDNERYQRKKTIRSIIQGIGLLVLAGFIIWLFVRDDDYHHFPESARSQSDDGFVAISYFGVDREGSETLISEKDLDEQLSTLHDRGYVTITEQDVLDYYQQGKPLPEKALYLMFEDGRRDTAIYAEKVMRKYNYCATMYSYVENYHDTEFKFLDPKDLLKLKDTGYWELGLNGYRLYYINVFDKDGKYLGNMDAKGFYKVNENVRRDYNHYLMDYLRDEDAIPTESHKEMEERITEDYRKMKRYCEDELGFLPEFYILQHSNTGAFATNPNASDVNERKITKNFAVNFNREGFSVDKKDTNVYDLTRMQPQAYWSVNHLLTRIRDDSKKDLEFVDGEEKHFTPWEVLKGSFQVKNEKHIVTSESKSTGMIRLKDLQAYHMDVNATLTGNVVGEQSILLRANEKGTEGLKVTIAEDKLELYTRSGGKDKLFSETELHTEGVPEEPEIKTAGRYKLVIHLKEQTIEVEVNGKPIVSFENLPAMTGQNICLEAGWSTETRWSQRNIADDVYDGVFEEFYIDDMNTKQVIDFEGRYTGFERFAKRTKVVMTKVIDWFVTYL